MANSMRTKRVPILTRCVPFLILFFSITASLFVLTAFISRVEINCNDDAYIYFTYARNIVQGRFFAYDSRNIPSEGFTSIFYLFMLVPFEWAGVNLMFASALLSIVGFLATAALALAMLYRNGFLNKKQTIICAPLLLALLLLNVNALVQTSWGLDTAWGFFFVLAAVACLCETLNPALDSSVRKGYWNAGFFVSLYLSLLCRPENAAYVCLLCLYSFAFHPMRKTFLKQLMIFFMILVAYAGWKAFYFRDVFPTAFYRKVSAFDTEFLPGLSYLLEFLRSSVIMVFAVVFGSVVYAVSAFQRRRLGRIVRHNHALILLALCGAANSLLVLKILPLIGTGFRFLFTLQFVLAILLAFFVIRLSTLAAGRLSVRFPAAFGLAPLGFLFFLSLCAWFAVRSWQHPVLLFERLNLSKRVDLSVEQHHYVRFGRFLREKLPNHERITLVFGDAGAIPYEFQCRFIDTNGLTEPYVARLFRERDPDVRAAKYARYILAQKPDIIVLNTGTLERGISIIQPNLQSPFGRQTRLSVWQAYRNNGFRYLVSLPMYYDLHIGVNHKSPYIGPIAAALEAYAKSNNGYRNPGGLTVSLGSQKVHFEEYATSSAH